MDDDRPPVLARGITEWQKEMIVADDKIARPMTSDKPDKTRDKGGQADKLLTAG